MAPPLSWETLISAKVDSFRSARLCLPLMVLTLVLASQAKAAIPPPKARYLIAVMDNNGGYFQAQTKGLLDNISTVTRQRTGLQFDVAFFKRELFKKVSSTAQADILFITYPEDYFDAMRTGKWRVAGGYSLFDKTVSKSCLFVPKASSYRTAMDLKGKTVMIYIDPYEFHALSNQVKSVPTKFFSRLLPMQSGMSAAYALSLGQVDAVQISEYATLFMEKTNPGPLRKIRKISCSDLGWGNPPILVKKTMPLKDVNSLFYELAHIGDIPAYHFVKAIMNLIHIKFYPATDKNFANWTGLRARYLKSGLKSDFDDWATVAQRSGRGN